MTAIGLCDYALVDDSVSELASPRRGHFDLGTGHHGDLWLDLDGLFLWPARLRPAAGWLAGELRRYQPAAICGPWSGGAFLAQQVAGLLAVAFLPTRPDQAGGYRLPGPLRERVSGWRVAIVDDAVNAGTAVRASAQEVRAAGGTPVAVATLLALGQAHAVVTRALGLPFHALASLPSQVWPTASCMLCRQGLPLG